MITIYRAMCKQERDLTISARKPSFVNRFKWFSPNLGWIKSRVCDKKFNNSNYRPEKYSHILVFEWNGLASDFQSTNEIQFDRRKNPSIKFIKELTKGLTMQLSTINTVQDGINAIEFVNNNIDETELIADLIKDLYNNYFVPERDDSLQLSAGIQAVLYVIFRNKYDTSLTKQELSQLDLISITDINKLLMISQDALLKD